MSDKGDLHPEHVGEGVVFLFDLECCCVGDLCIRCNRQSISSSKKYIWGVSELDFVELKLIANKGVGWLVMAQRLNLMSKPCVCGGMEEHTS